MAKKKFDRIKVVGYARRIFFNDNIEYRNFSPDLCGFQVTSEGGTTLFTNCNFSIDVNLEPKPEVVFKQGAQSKPYTLDDIVSDNIELAIQKNLTAGLNLNISDPLSFVWYGSAAELIRSSLENIYENWPAAIYVDNKVGSVSGDNITNYVYDITKDESTFTLNSRYFVNPYSIKYTSDAAITGTEIEANPLRNFTVKYKSYTIEHNGIIKNIKEITPTSQVTDADLGLTVDGNPFPELTGINLPQYSFLVPPTGGSIPFFIKPSELERENFFSSLNDMQQNLLNRNTVPPYTSIIIAPEITDSGVIVTTKQLLVFPLWSDGYNLNFFDGFYISYLDTVNNVGKNYDEFNTDLIIRKYTAEVISSFDTVPRGDGDDLELDGEKATKLLRIYGVGFDEVKKYINGIKLAHVVTYDKKNNIPDSLVKDLSQMLGLQPGNFVTNIDLIKTVIPQPGATEFSGSSTALSPQEIDIELYRRLILNIAWIWRNKGTRKAVEFLFRFIGAPESIVRFNEYIAMVDKPLDMDQIKNLIYLYTGEKPDVKNIPYDKNGFPLPPSNGTLVPIDFGLVTTENNLTEMYFQKAGGWYRETFGPNAGITILEGNNPHVGLAKDANGNIIGQYDGGNEYLNFFSKCYIPNFSGKTTVTITEENFSENAFINYNYGIFNGIDVDSFIFSSEVTYNPTNQNYELISSDCIEVSYNIIEAPLQPGGNTTLQNAYITALSNYNAYLELIKIDSYLKYSPEWQVIKYNYEQAKKKYGKELITEECVFSAASINQALEICLTPIDQSINVDDVTPCEEYEVNYVNGFIYFTLDGVMINEDFRICCEAQQSADNSQSATYVSYMTVGTATQSPYLVEYCAFDAPCTGIPIGTNDTGYVIFELVNNTNSNNIFNYEGTCYNYNYSQFCDSTTGADATWGPTEFAYWYGANLTTQPQVYNQCFTEVPCGGPPITIYTTAECCAWHGYESQTITVTTSTPPYTATVVVCVDSQGIGSNTESFTTVDSPQNNLSYELELVDFMMTDFELILNNANLSQP